MHAPASEFVLSSSSTNWKYLDFVNEAPAEIRIAAMYVVFIGFGKGHVLDMTDTPFLTFVHYRPIVRLLCDDKQITNSTSTVDVTNSGRPSNGTLILERIVKFLKWRNLAVQETLLRTMTEMAKSVKFIGYLLLSYLLLLTSMAYSIFTFVFHCLASSMMVF